MKTCIGMIVVSSPLLLAASVSNATCAARLRNQCDHADYPHTRHAQHPAVYAAWHAAWEARCATPVRTAARLASNRLVNHTTLENRHVPAQFAADGRKSTEWHYLPRAIDAALRSRDGCLVYSFGVSHRDEFTDFYAAQGCHVFAFDPTVNHPTAWKENVTFHPWGLRSATSEGEHEVKTLGQYGSVFGELLSLREIMQRVGHAPDALITAFKLVSRPAAPLEHTIHLFVTADCVIHQVCFVLTTDGAIESRADRTVRVASLRPSRSSGVERRARQTALPPPPVSTSTGQRHLPARLRPGF